MKGWRSCRLVRENAVQTGLPCWTHVKNGKLVQNCAKFLIERVLGELDFAHVEVADATDFEVFVDDRGGLPLRFREDDVQEVRRRRDGGDGLEPARRHLDSGCELQ